MKVFEGIKALGIFSFLGLLVGATFAAIIFPILLVEIWACRMVGALLW